MALLSQKTGLPSFSAVDASIVNYFTDPGFERGTDGTLPDGWLQYNDGAVAVPVNGTGGSANANVTLLTTTAGAIRGTKSALLTKGPGNQQGTGYSYDFTISNVDKGVTAGVDFELITSSAYVSGDVVFYIYDVTNSILITPRAVSLPALPNYGRFFSDYGLQTGTQYRFILHIATTNASAWTMILDTMTNSTTRTAVPGAPVSIFETVSAYTIGATTTPPTPGTGATFYRQTVNNGDGTATIRFEYRQTVAGTTGTGDYLFPLPNGLTIDYTRVGAVGLSTPASDVGDGSLVVNTTNVILRAHALNSGAYANKIYCTFYNDTFAGSAWGSTGAALNNTTVIASFTVRVPIVQWAGSGTNGAASVTQWASDDGTSDVLGPQGSLVPNVAFATGITLRTFSFSIPQDLRQFVRCEINYRGFGWSSASDLFPYARGNNASSTNFYGVQAYWSSSTVFTVGFGNQGTTVDSSTVSNGSSSWATEFSNGTRFRVGLSIGGVFIGVNMANSTQLGFVAPRKGQYNLSLTSSLPGWSTGRAAAVYYQDQDGAHRLKFNIAGSATSGTYTANTFTITGVLFKNAANYYQACSGVTGVVGLGCRTYTVPNSNQIVIDHASSTVTLYSVSGDVELESRPSWA